MRYISLLFIPLLTSCSLHCAYEWDSKIDPVGIIVGDANAAEEG